ncbi:MAG: hypothetical protein HYR84_03595 [Planctomycetes bacterium]|nr:hypothetical protein [Planctomycetota bacterium]
MFRRVEAQQAGPTALGILVPLEARTPVIVRPRRLDWDLLPARWDGDAGQPPQFCAFARDEAVEVARRFIAALETAVETGDCPVQTVGDSRGERLQVWLRIDALVWIACTRVPGKPYRPMLFGSLAEATQAAEKLIAIVWPAPDAVQEYYFNTQGFS